LKISAEEYKVETRKQWNATPCGTDEALNRLGKGSLAFFDAVRRSRYEVTDAWMTRVMNFHSAAGKRLLEVGYGMGTDLLTWCENGAEVHGIDLTEEHHRLAVENFGLHNCHADLRVGDAAKLPFEDESFDIVYSHGVLHHTPDIEQCLSEIRRVLRPGGRLILGLYHKWSAFHIYSKIFYDGLVRGLLFTHGYAGLMATLERGADGARIRPLVRTYSRGEVRRLLSSYSDVDIKVAGLGGESLPRIGRFIPGAVIRKLEPWLGWYVVGIGNKK